MNVSDFKITFKRDPFFGFWFWIAKGKGIKLNGPSFGMCVTKEGAERDALRRLRLYCDEYKLSGAELEGRAG